jgi:hypothetical protein
MPTPAKAPTQLAPLGTTYAPTRGVDVLDVGCAAGGYASSGAVALISKTRPFHDAAVNVLVVPPAPTALLTTSYEQADWGRRVVRYTIPPGFRTAVVVEMATYALCELRPYGDVHNKTGLTLLAGSDGTVVFHVRPPPIANVVVSFVLSSVINDDRREVMVQLRADFGEAPGWPRPPARPQVLNIPHERVLPALSEELAMRASGKELRRLGYPGRPDPEKAPGHFDKWFKVFSKPLTILDSSHACASRTWINGPNTNQFTWSGVELFAPPYTIIGVQGLYFVPSVMGDLANADTPTVGTMWVGLDGDASALPPNGGTFIQTGMQWQATITPVVSGNWETTSYFGWFQMPTPLRPNPPLYTGWAHSLPQADFPIDSGDYILAQCFYDQPLRSARFVLANHTKQWITSASVLLPGTAAPVTGQLAEWIIERPGLSPPPGNQPPSIFPLADFGTAQMWASVFTNGVESGDGLPAFLGNAPNRTVTMVQPGSNETIAVANPGGIDIVAFTWRNFGQTFG